MTDPQPVAELSDAEFEALAAEIHVVYCEEYERRFSEPYWTGGDYSKLDEPTKNYDRNLVRWYLAKTAAARKQLAQAEAQIQQLEEAGAFQAMQHGMRLAQAEQRAEAAEADCAALREALRDMTRYHREVFIGTRKMQFDATFNWERGQEIRELLDRSQPLTPYVRSTKVQP